MDLNRTLVVEDDLSWQDILAEILQDSGLDVDIARDLQESVCLIRENTHRIAIVDLSLGGSDHRNQDGIKVVDFLNEHDPGCITIMLTGYATVELAVRLITDLGVMTCLQKENFNRSQFQEIINRALVKKPPILLTETARSDLIGTAKKSHSSHIDKNSSDNVQLTSDPINKNMLVLVVDDDAGWRNIYEELLEEARFPFRSCKGFAEALGLLKREKFACAIIDLALENPSNFYQQFNNEVNKDLDGYRLLASTLAAKIPTIVVSGIADAPEVERAYQEYALFSFIQKKAFDRSIFLNTINEAVENKSDQRLFSLLTEREREVLGYLGQGLTNKEIAEKMVVSPNTVKRHIKSIFSKLEVHTRSAVAAKVVGLTE